MPIAKLSSCISAKKQSAIYWDLIPEILKLRLPVLTALVHTHKRTVKSPISADFEYLPDLEPIKPGIQHTQSRACWSNTINDTTQSLK